MKMEIKIPQYKPRDGLQLEWENNFSIKVINDDAITIKGNRAGLISLARHLLTLAQIEVPDGYHIHLDENNSLEDGSVDLILERDDFL